MRVAIASRIYAPETSAASIRLKALTQALAHAQFEIEVLTTKPPGAHRNHALGEVEAHIKRWPVLRDKQGYVRGYLQYMSFDVPLLFRILFGKRKDLIIVEPPPTTGVMVRIAAWVRRTPFMYYAADIWSDAAQQTGASRWVLQLVAMLEKWVWRGADSIFSVSEGVTQRLLELEPNCRVETVGNGIDTSVFPNIVAPQISEVPKFVYAGTASEWHGAEIFVDAFAKLVKDFPNAQLMFIGGGSERELLAKKVHQYGLEDSVTFQGTLPVEKLIPVLQQATASLASLRPGSGYDFAFPTKMLTSTATGTPVIFTGSGPAIQFVGQEVESVPLGVACKYRIQEVTESMHLLASNPVSSEKRQMIVNWARTQVSIAAPAKAIVAHIQQLSTATTDVP